jgi:hypothetical protein
VPSVLGELQEPIAIGEIRDSYGIAKERAGIAASRL